MNTDETSLPLPALKPKPGRAAKVTEEVMQAVARLVSGGLTEAEAARQCGLKPSTVRSSKRRSAAFTALIEAAKAERLITLVAAIQHAGLVDSQGKGPDWRAAAWLLERLYRERFGAGNVTTFQNCQVIAGMDQDLINQIRKCARERAAEIKGCTA